MEKIPCAKCGKLILPATAERNSGLCVPCTRASAEKPPEFDTRVYEAEYLTVRDQVSAKIGKALAARGFMTDDSLRYIRAHGPVLHYFVFVPWKADFGNNKGLTDGMHLKALFGEALTYEDEFRKNCPLSHEANPPANNRCIRIGGFDIGAWETPDQRRRNSIKYIEAIERICADRFDNVTDESQYCEYVLGLNPTATKIYCLTRLGRNDEADAWLYLNLHKYAGLRTISGAYPRQVFSTFIDDPSSDLLMFSSMSPSERLQWIDCRMQDNLAMSKLEWIYEGS